MVWAGEDAGINTICKQERGCLVQFVRVANTLLNVEENA